MVGLEGAMYAPRCQSLDSQGTLEPLSPINVQLQCHHLTEFLPLLLLSYLSSIHCWTGPACRV